MRDGRRKEGDGRWETTSIARLTRGVCVIFRYLTQPTRAAKFYWENAACSAGINYIYKYYIYMYIIKADSQLISLRFRL